MLLILAAVLDTYGQNIGSMTDFMLQEQVFLDSVSRANPDISREERKSLLKQFYRRHYPMDQDVVQTSRAALAYTQMATPDLVPDEVEYQALVAFYHATGGASWKANTNWLQGTTIADIGNWHGITVANGDVIKIVLPANDLTDSLPPSIGQLKALRELSLYNNNISGELPVELGGLNALTIINLSNNDIYGFLPAEISNITGLTNLQLTGNNMSGFLPPELGQLSKLRVLSLNVNNFIGQIPATIGDLSDLDNLGLAANNFVGSIPPELGQLSKLRVLGLSTNRLSGHIPPLLGNLSNLSILSLDNNDLSGPIPASFENLTSLRQLGISRNNLTGTIPPALGNLEFLRSISLYENGLHGTIPPELGNLKNLESLNLYANTLTGAVPETLKDLPKLYVMFLYNNQFTHFPDFTGVPHASQLYVNIDNNQLTFESLEVNYSAPGVSVLDFFGYENQSAIPLYIDRRTSTLSVEIAGNHNRYQWFKNDVAIANATQSSLVLDPEDINLQNTYYCRVTNTMANGSAILSETQAVEVDRSVFYAVRDGNWGQPGTWAFEPDGMPVQSIPHAHATVFIEDHHITVTSGAACKSVTLSVAKANASLTVDGATMDLYAGELTLLKKENGFPANVKVINEGKIQIHKEAITY